jgi:hypothetical protein
MDVALKVIGVLAIPVLWGLASARFIEWLRQRHENREKGGGDRA